MKLDNYLTVDEIQKKTLVDKDVIRRHIRLGRLKTFQFNNRGTHLISIEEYEHWKKNVAKIKETKTKSSPENEKLSIDQTLKRIESKLDQLLKENK